ncbi:hypothetical protein MRX96_058822 [Rhipicephalus microplus]
MTAEKPMEFAPSVVRIFYSNEEVRHYNAFIVDQHQQEWGGYVVYLYAYDTFRGCKTQAVVDNAGCKVTKMSTAEFGNLPHEIWLVVGQPYMITHNIDMVKGLVNGAVGTRHPFTSAARTYRHLSRDLLTPAAMFVRTNIWRSLSRGLRARTAQVVRTPI